MGQFITPALYGNSNQLNLLNLRDRTSVELRVYQPGIVGGTEEKYRGQEGLENPLWCISKEVLCKIFTDSYVLGDILEILF